MRADPCWCTRRPSLNGSCCVAVVARSHFLHGFGWVKSLRAMAVLQQASRPDKSCMLRKAVC